jgi:hypothetical protein
MARKIQAGAHAQSEGVEAGLLRGRGMSRRNSSVKRPSTRTLKERPSQGSEPWNWLTVSNQAE